MKIDKNSLLVQIESNLFTCSLVFSEKRAERFVKNMLNLYMKCVDDNSFFNVKYEKL